MSDPMDLTGVDAKTPVAATPKTAAPKPTAKKPTDFIPEAPAGSPWIAIPAMSDELCRVEAINKTVRGRGARVLLRARTSLGVSFHVLEGFHLSKSKGTGDVDVEG